MNILQLIPALDQGGVERGTVDLAREFVKKGHSVFVISSGGSLVRELKKSGTTHITLAIHKKDPSIILRILDVTKIIKAKKIDVVHASSRVPAWIGFFACKLTGTPFVTSCHGFYSKHFFSRVMGWGDPVMVISKTIEKRMMQDFNVAEDRIRLVYRGLNIDSYKYFPDKYDTESEKYLVVNIARITPIKGQYEFLKAMKIVKDRFNKDVKIWIVGGVDINKEGYLHKLSSLVKELDMTDSVRFFGLISDVGSILKEADCLVLSSNVPEGFGRTIIEAGASGTACCASGIGGITEIIEDGVSGLLFPPGNEEKMAEAIIKMLSDRAFCKSCAANLRAKVEKDFTLEQMASKTFAVYEEAIGK